MPFTVRKRRIQKNIKIPGNIGLILSPRAEYGNIGIIMFPGQSGDGIVVQQCGSDSFVSVGRNRNSDSRAADKHAEICPAAYDFRGHFIRNQRIIARFGRISPQIDYFYPFVLTTFDICNDSTFAL